MTLDRETYCALAEIAEGEGFKARLKLRELLPTLTLVEVLETPANALPATTKSSWTGSQRNAVWLYCTLKSTQLNDAGLEMRKVLKPEISIPWTKDSFHDHVWIPIQKAMYGTESMRDLQKPQISPIHDVIEREFAEKHGVEQIEIPSEERINVRLAQMENLNSTNYPEYQGPPKI